MITARHTGKIIALGIVLLFFLQVLADFIEHVYVFGLLGTSIPPEIVAVLFLLTPFLLLGRRRLPDKRYLIALLAMLFIARLLEPVLPTRGRMLVAGAGVGAFMLWLPAQLLTETGPAKHTRGIWTGAIIIAVLLSVALRSWGWGLDLSTVGWGQLIGWGLALIAVWYLSRLPATPAEMSDSFPAQRPFAAAIGLMAVIALLYFVFSAPHVLARWTGVDYRQIILLFGLSWGLALLTWVRGRVWQPQYVLLGNVLLVGSLALTAFVHQSSFPADAAAYPFFAPATGWLQALPLFLSIALSPLLAFDFGLLAGSLVAARPRPARMGLIMGLAALLLLMLILAHVFTTVYDYIPVIGPWFRNQFWLVHLVTGVLLLITVPRQRIELPSLAPSLAATMVALAGLAMIGGLVRNMPPPAPTELPTMLTVQTYNIQQGYSEDGQRNFDGQLAVLQQIDADIIGLQESDNARVAGGNADVVRYFAQHLRRYAYYGPKTVTGTFGIALLSRYPIRNPRTAFLYSEGEQVAVILADIQIQNQLVHVLVTHLGNGGPMIQQDQLLQLLPDSGPIIVMGDFNFRPSGDQYVITTRVLQDSWTEKWPDWQDDEGHRPLRKIDHIFVSPGTKVLDARWIESPASDHPSVTATVAW